MDGRASLKPVWNVNSEIQPVKTMQNRQWIQTLKLTLSDHSASFVASDYVFLVFLDVNGTEHCSVAELGVFNKDQAVRRPLSSTSCFISEVFEPLKEGGETFILLVAFRHFTQTCISSFSGLNLCRRYLRYAPAGLRACLLPPDKPCGFKWISTTPTSDPPTPGLKEMCSLH